MSRLCYTHVICKISWTCMRVSSLNLVVLYIKLKIINFKINNLLILTYLFPNMFHVVGDDQEAELPFSSNIITSCFYEITITTYQHNYTFCGLAYVTPT